MIMASMHSHARVYNIVYYAANVRFIHQNRKYQPKCVSCVCVCESIQTWSLSCRQSRQLRILCSPLGL